MRSAAVQQIGRAVATDIGAARAGGGLGYMPHKLLHGITGAITGALLNPDNIASGAIAGSMGAAVGEVIAEELMPTDDEMKAQISQRVDQEQIIKGRLFTPAEREQAAQAAAADLQAAAKFDIQLKSRLAVTATMGLMGLDPVKDLILILFKVSSAHEQIFINSLLGSAL